MPRVASEGKVKVYWLPTVSDKEAPTEAEITAGTNLTPQVPTAGLDITWTQNNASISMLDEAFTAEQVGTFGASISLTFTRDDDEDEDTAWDLFERNLNGFLLISRFGIPEDGSRVEVYPASSHNPVPLAPAENEFQQFQVQLAVHDTPELKAIVGGEVSA